MRGTSNAWLAYVFFLLVGMLTACNPVKAGSETPKAVRGVINLSQINFTRQGSISLDGEWEFYWKQLRPPSRSGYADGADLIRVPGSWNEHALQERKITGNGFGTYRLRIVLGKSYKEPLALRLPLIHTAANVWINGQLVYQSGKVGKTPTTTQPQYRPAVVRFVPDASTLEVIIQVANFHYSNGGIRRSITLGSESTLHQDQLMAVATEFWLLGSILIMALYHLGLFLIHKRSASPLYFGLFCLLVTLRIFVTGEYTVNLFFDPNWWWLIRLEYLTYTVSVALFTLFLYVVFPETFFRTVVITVAGAAAFFSLLVLCCAPNFFTWAIVPFQWFTVLIALYGFYAILRACYQQIDGSIPFLLGYLILAITFTNDILHANEYIQTGHFVSLGLFLFIFSQAFLISRRFSRAFNELETAMGELAATNQKLSETYTLVEEQNEELWHLNTELDSFVYRTSHDLRAPIASVLGLINLAQQEENLSQIKHYLSLKEKSLKKLDNVIRDIIDYARNKSLALEATPMNFTTLIEEIFASHDYMENAGRITKTVDWSSQDVFFSDRKRIDIILNNLVSNAIRYYNPYQEASFIKVKVASDRTGAIIEVRDNGLGIAREYQEKIFEMFFRISNQGGGSGIGLYVVRETVHKLGGTITLESEVNKGTLFTVKLPSLSPVAAESTPVSPGYSK